MHFIQLKKETNNYSKCSAFASSAHLHLFFKSNSVTFVEGGRKNIFCPRAQGNQATPLLECSGPERSKDCNRATAVTTKLQRSNAAHSVDMFH